MTTESKFSDPELKKLLQKHFETAVRGILKQGGFAIKTFEETGSYKCVYRMPVNGKTWYCIAGQLFAREDDLYNKNMDDGVSSISDLLRTNADIVDHLQLTKYKLHDSETWLRIVNFFQDLQRVHDQQAHQIVLVETKMKQSSLFIERVKEFADRNDLNTDFMDTCENNFESAVQQSS